MCHSTIYLTVTLYGDFYFCHQYVTNLIFVCCTFSQKAERLYDVRNIQTWLKFTVDFNLEKVKHYIFTLCLCFVYKINNIFMLTIIFLLTYIYINIYLDIFGPFNVIEL